MNEKEAKAFEVRKWQIIDSKMGILEAYIKEWKSAFEEGKTNFTEREIDLLETLAEANLMNQGNRQGLNDNQRKMKEAVRRRMRNSLSDLDRMAKHDFIGIGASAMTNSWNPKVWGSDTDRLMFDFETIQKELSVKNLCAFVECMVSTYGDIYAIPLVGSIKKGLVDYEQRSPKPWELNYEIDVPIIRRTRTTVF